MGLISSHNPIVYTRKLSRSRRSIGISISREGGVIVRAAARVPDSFIVKLLDEKRAWILEKIAYIQSLPPLVPLVSVAEDYKKQKIEAMELLQRLVDEVNAHYQFSYREIVVRRMKSRWGTCSRTGKLTFNVAIMQLPEHLQRYIVVHEVCHLRYFNHGEGFWGAVAQVAPQYRACRKELRGYDLRG